MTVNRIIGQQGYTRMSGTPKAAGRPISFWLRDTICLNRGNGAWKIVHRRCRDRWRPKGWLFRTARGHKADTLSELAMNQ